LPVSTEKGFVRPDTIIDVKLTGSDAAHELWKNDLRAGFISMMTLLGIFWITLMMVPNILMCKRHITNTAEPQAMEVDWAYRRSDKILKKQMDKQMNKKSFINDFS
jgi:hypothetical protein